MSGTAPLTVEQWREFLGEYSRQLLASPNQQLERFTPDGIITVPRFAPEVQAGGWLGSEPCREADLEAAEGRLGRSLPPSFRNFYLVTDGWTDAGQFGEDVWPLQRVDWLRDTEFGDLIGAWSDVLDPDQLAVLESSLIIAYADGGAGDYWLLAPPSAVDQPEWTAYRWAAGAGEDPEPFESFGALMQEAREGA